MAGQNGKLDKILSLLLIFHLSWSAEPEKLRSIRVRQGSPFKIALFADLHFGEDAWTSWGPLQDVNSINLMSSLLDRQKPDFVIYLGDVITANNIAIANATSYWNQALSPVKDRGIPWASLFGNHDDAKFEWPLEWFSASGIPPLNCFSAIPSSDGSCNFMGTTRLQLINHERGSNNLSFSQNGPTNLWPSVSNYALQLASSNNSGPPVAFFYFLDSGGGSYPEVISYEQARWFNTTSHKINPESRVPEIVFWHIPSKAYSSVAPSGMIAKPCVGSINYEKVAHQEAEHGIMKVLESRPSVQAVFVGHNHGLDWCCPHKKLWLCFARHTGYGGYGSWARGARILEITEHPFSLKSWISMEDGLVHSQLILSS